MIPPYYSTRRGASTFEVGIWPAQHRMTYPHPAFSHGYAEYRIAFYEQMFAYYSNTAFDNVNQWLRYKRRYNLYRHTRGIFNPMARLVDFYADHVYPGLVSIDPDLPEGIQQAIPLSPNTPTEVSTALAQTWQWSNWQVGKSTMVTFGAMVGNCLVEILDDVEGGNVRYNVVWPGFVKEFHLDSFGNLESYQLQYSALDEKGIFYLYGKYVDREQIVTFRDGSVTEKTANPYPFVPAVWVKHLDIGSDFGLSAVKGGLPKFDELNSIVSHTADHIHKQVNSPRILWASGHVKELFKNQEVDDSDFDVRNDLLLLKGDQGGSTETLVGNLDPATIVPVIDKIIAEIEKDYPEITVYDKLRQQNITTGPAARMQMGDVAAAVLKPSSCYDSASQRLFQMALAVGGWRANEGHWGTKLTPQQEKFLPFDLSSYEQGDLDIQITPRPFIKEDEADKASELQQRTQAVASVQNILPIEELYEMLGYRKDQIPDMVKRYKQEQADKQAQTIALAQATKPQPQPQPGAGAPAKKPTKPSGDQANTKK